MLRTGLELETPININCVFEEKAIEKLKKILFLINNVTDTKV